MTQEFPILSVDKTRPGIIRYQGADELTGILAGLHAAEIVRRCNAFPYILKALEVALEDSERESTRRILRDAIATTS